MLLPSPPTPGMKTGGEALRALLAERSLLPALKAMHAGIGDAFTLSLPGFHATLLTGPAANRFVLVEARRLLRWRNEHDPVTQLLRQGLLVVDGQQHEYLRRLMTGAFHRRRMEAYVEKMWRLTDQVCNAWDENQPLDMLVEMRRVTLLILMNTLFKVDFHPHLDPLWPAILRLLAYISPGAWLVWKDIPRPGYTWAINRVDEYLYGLITSRRAQASRGDDLLSHFIADPTMSDGLIRDQILTLLIAGHDTSTALLAWTLYLFARHPEAMRQASAEVQAVLGNQPPQPENLGQLVYLGQVIDETLRLYPPIHVGNRQAITDLEFNGYHIPAGDRLMYSIYLTHHDQRLWPDSELFNPGRFAPGVKRQPYAFLPFGGGPRNCIGATYARVEAKVVLARLLQRFDFSLLDDGVRLRMGATLEPSPGVLVNVKPRP